MRLFLTAALAACAGALGAQASEVPRAQVGKAAGYTLVGCAKRSLMWHDLYDLALFAGNDGGGLIVMQVLHEGDMPDGLPDDWPPKLEEHLTDGVIEDIDSAFALVRPESRVEIAYLPSGDVTQVSVDARPALRVPRRAAFDAIAAMWFGEDPISEDLKEDILSGECDAR